jgi:hypothetical protein
LQRDIQRETCQTGQKMHSRALGLIYDTGK